jgi:hypothetical protein
MSRIDDADVEFVAFATRLKFKRKTPKDIRQLVDMIYGIEYHESFGITDVILDRPCFNSARVVYDLKTLLTATSQYFPTYGWRTRQDFAQHQEYESYSSYASHRGAIDKFFMLLTELQKYLILQEGDIIARKVLPNSVREEILVYTGGDFEITDGYEYARDVEGGLCDSNHPSAARFPNEVQFGYLCGSLSRIGRPQVEDLFTLPWTLAELDSITPGSISLKSSVIVSTHA